MIAGRLVRVRVLKIHIILDLEGQEGKMLPPMIYKELLDIMQVVFW